MDNVTESPQDSQDTENASKVVKVLISERSPRLAIGISQVLDKSRLVKVVARTEDPRRITELVEVLKPDVVLINADRPGLSLVDLCAELREHRIGIVLLSTESQRGPVREALTAGAHSIIAWPCRPRDLVLAVVNAARASKGSSDLSAMPDVETEVKGDAGLATGKLAPLIGWASHNEASEVSSRLKRE